jgi:hypothetical protein
MYCPKCGQSQVSAEVRFCSRCGFPLVGVVDLLSTGGHLPSHMAGEGNSPAKAVSPRRRGVKRGIGIMLIGIFLFPFFGIMHEVTGFPLEFMALGAIVCMLAVLRLVYATFFEDGAPRTPRVVAPPQAYTPPFASRLHAPAQESLPPAQQRGVPVNDYRQPQVDTAQIMHPPSVTDHTTRLLEKQSDPSER